MHKLNVVFFNPYADQQTKGASRKIEFLSRLLAEANIPHSSMLAEEYEQVPKSGLEKLMLTCGLRRVAYFLHARKLCRDRSTIVISEVIFTPTWLPNMVPAIHDLKTFDPKATRGGAVRRLAYLVFTRLARHIVVDSVSVYDDMVKLCHIPPQKICIIPVGISQAHMALAASFHGQERQYDFIYVSSFARHKRQAMMLRAAPAGSRICLIGRDLGSLAEIKAEAARRANEIHVDIREDIVTDQQLFKLLGQARCGVFPSVFEGFGIPILEYAASGLHVIASDIPPFRELAQHIDRFVAPDDEADLRTAMNEARQISLPAQATKAQIVANSPFCEETIGKRLVQFLESLPAATS